MFLYGGLINIYPSFPRINLIDWVSFINDSNNFSPGRSSPLSIGLSYFSENISIKSIILHEINFGITTSPDSPYSKACCIKSTL